MMFEPLKLRGKVAPNRILFGAHCTNFATDNLPNQRHTAYYARRAEGGAGLIVLEESSVHPSDWPDEKAIKGYDERIIPRYRMVAEAVHAHGALALAQLNHNGMQASGHVHKQVVWAASAVANPATMEMPKVMEVSDIEACIEGFARTTRLAIQGGLDGVEINAGQYSLLRQFLSGLTNFRQDEYGGSLENRLRLLKRVLSSVRQVAGPDNMVGLRLSCDEYAPWAGLKPEDGIEIAGLLCATGEIDYLVVVTGSIYTLHATSPAMHTPAGQNLELAAKVREVAKGVAVFGGDNGVDASTAHAWLSNGGLGGLDMTRALIADPDLPNKFKAGQADQIRPCIRCNQDCVVRSPLNQVVSCIHNPEAGYEREFPALEKAPQPRRVLVVGAGPGGLEVARVAALRGHQVAVYEKEKEPGGTLRFAALAPTRAEMLKVIEWRLNELKRLGVPVELGVEVTTELIEKLQPEVIVVASGARRRPSEIPGANLPHVVGPREVLAGSATGRGKAVIIDYEGYQAAINTADFLAAQNRPVEIVTEDFFVSIQLGALQELTPWYSRAAASNITLSPLTKVVAIEPNLVKVRHHFDTSEEVRIIEGVDTVVMVNYDLPEDTLYQQLKSSGLAVYRVGDAQAPRRVTHAILEAQRVGTSI
jgi:mycofactocin system FadH/OYE family oxidoreductase 2